MTNSVSPSPVIECFLREFKDWLPDDQKAKLKEHEAAIAATTSDADRARALRCARWAVEAADDKDPTHPRWKEVKEAHALWKDSLIDAEFGLATPKSGIAEDVMIGLAEDAADVICKLGDEDGWEKSDWENLLVELISLKAD
jgi:hypothetical protein